MNTTEDVYYDFLLETDILLDTDIGSNETYEREVLLSMNGGILQVLTHEKTPVLEQQYDLNDIKKGYWVCPDPRFDWEGPSLA